MSVKNSGDGTWMSSRALLVICATVDPRPVKFYTVVSLLSALLAMLIIPLS